MISEDEDALRCDLAETYHIYDYEELPVSMVALFSCGLRENSRIKMKLSGQRIPTETALIALGVDALRDLVWSKTKDAEKGKNRPPSIYDALTKTEENKPREHIVFDSPEAFEMALQTVERR